MSTIQTKILKPKLGLLYQNPLLTEQIRNITNSFNSSTGNIDNKIMCDS
ncbi:MULTISPECIES: hypothetical protein [unclassified Wolbachia]|nr:MULTISPECIES: hypothetical protein [unclassified Wolbachia]